MSRLKFLLIAVLLLMAVAPAMAQQANVPTGLVNTGSLNVRSGPGLEYGSITTLPYGFGVTMIGRNPEGNWVFISLTNGLQGWVNVNYLLTSYRISQLPINNSLPASDITPRASNTGIFTLNVFESPDAVGGRFLRSATLSEQFDLLGRNYNGTWAQIRLADGTVGWVQAEFITATVPVRSLQPTDGSVFVPVFTGTAVPGGSTQTPRAGRTYTIQRGDTLSAIARRYNVDVNTLAAANSIFNVDVIYAGQVLVIP
jgi:LysM repeat protein